VWRRNAPLLGAGATTTADLDAWGRSLRESLAAKMSEPDIFERYRRDMADRVQPRRTLSLPFQAASEAERPVDSLIFDRPMGRHHAITEENGVVTLSAAGSELQLEGVDARLLTTIFELDKFSVADIQARHPQTPGTDIAELVGALLRLGLLRARAR
jgi:hypothetical protein